VIRQGSLRNPIALYYVANWLYRHHVPIMPRLLQILLFLLCNAVVPYRAQIGAGCLLGHGGSGVVIHTEARLGRNVLICQQVTIGGTGKGLQAPILGDDIYIGAGAKILGPVTLGNGCVIGANAVVVKSVPPRCVVAGVPARVLRENIDSHAVEDW
jgi:serine O-acetyltransferase